MPATDTAGRRSGGFAVAAIQPNSIADELLARMPTSPDAYPQKLDLARDAVLLVRMDAAAYRKASFLDDRVLRPDTQGAWLPTEVIHRAVGRARDGCPVLHYIFHTGHVGSTLVSRLLDEAGSVLSLREPLPLRTLADAHDVLALPESLLSQAQFDRDLALFTTLWRRGYETTRAVVLKATSSAGRLAVPLLAASPASRGIYLNLRAEPYLATLLAGPNSPADLRGHGPARIRRLQARVTSGLALPSLHVLSSGELAAMSWLAESWSQFDALEQHPDRLIALDFDQFLADVAESMRRILVHFDLPADSGYLSEITRSPVLRHYSKAPEYSYTPTARAELLNESRRANRREILQGLAWLERLAHGDSSVAAMVNGKGL